MPEAIVDFDDLCDQWDPYDLLCTLKDNDENFKVTLFTIPMKCSPALIKRYKAHSGWIELAMHGWWHTTGEVFSWTIEEAMDKMRMAEKMGIDGHGFKAPKWLVDQTVYDACREMGWYVADHKKNRWREPAPGERIYITDLNGPQLRLHGHTRNVCGNGIEEAFPMFMLPSGKFTYKFISEVV